MEDYLSIVQACGLFAGVNSEELQAMLHCLSPKISDYAADQFIFTAGQSTQAFGLVLEGQVHILHEDYWGNRNILSAVSSGEIFGESFAALGTPMNVSAMVANSTKLMLFNLRRVISTCTAACPHHRRIIENLMAMLAAKNQLLNEKLLHMSKRSTREKLLSYLSAEAAHQNKNPFEIPFNRQQLADYLSVDRSALSAEISKLKKECILDAHKSIFKILR